MKRSVNGLLKPSSKTRTGSYKNHLVRVRYYQTISPEEVARDVAQRREQAHTHEEAVMAQVPKQAVKQKKAGDTRTGAKETHETETKAKPAGLNTISTAILRSLEVPVTPSGTFVFSVEGTIQEPVSLQVLAPDQSTLHEGQYSTHDLNAAKTSEEEDNSQPMVITVDPFQLLTLSAVGGTAPYKVRGRVLGFADGEAVAGRSFFLYTQSLVEPSTKKAAKSGATVSEAPLLHFNTDAFGYFSFTMPGDPIVGAFARLAGSEAQIPVALAPEGKVLKPQQILVVEGELPSEQAAAADDCACHTATPLLPDAEDLALSPEYADEGGTCVDFTTPNRSLEEFSYYHVVRTTEPEIKKVPWQKPPRLDYNSTIPQDVYEEPKDPITVDNSAVEGFDQALHTAYYAYYTSQSDYKGFGQIRVPNYQSNPGFYQGHNSMSLLNAARGFENAVESAIRAIPRTFQYAYQGTNTTYHGNPFWFFILSPAEAVQRRFSDLKAVNDPSVSAYSCAAEFFLGGAYPNVGAVAAYNPFVELGSVPAMELMQQFNDQAGSQGFSSVLNFWRYCAKQYYKSFESMPPDPWVFRQFIETSVMGLDPSQDDDGTPDPGSPAAQDWTAEIQRWWLFTQPTVPTDPATSIPALKQKLAELFFNVYAKKHTYESELYNFMRLTVDHFYADSGEAPPHPAALYQYIQHQFADGAKGRIALNGNHPVDWDETPTLFQNTTIAHGHLLHFKQVWKADGYSMGDLLYSLPLAPCQKKQIAIFDWNRKEVGSRTELTSAEESMSAHLDRDRDVTDILHTALGESIKGGSKADTESESTTKSMTVSAGLAAGNGAVGASVGVSAGKSTSSGSSSADSNAWQNSARTLTGNTMNQYRDRIMQGASAVRSQRSTV
ncbi:MAG: hypothetical protein AAFQ98_16975, partial [Bacteroidota bacterium]